MKKLLIIAIGGGLFFATSCKKEGCTDSTATNYNDNAKKDDGSCVYPIPVDTSYEIPATYTFKDANGNSTVSFKGQKERLDMLGELVAYMKTANTAGTAINAQTLKDMYANSGYTWTDANGLGLTGSSKNLKDKTAAGDAGIQTIFEDYMDALAALSATTVTSQENGTSGTGGVWPNDGVKGPYLMNGEGKEYTQLIEKGLMGAVFANQMTMKYLANLANDDNTTAADPANGKYHTAMEHHFDEAYGYFTSEVDYPTNGTDRFWGKYASSREAVLGSKTKISEAFRKGRAAISNKDYVTRDAQVAIINLEMEKVAAGTAINYLKGAKANIANPTARNHSLSEATAFIEGLKYGYRASNGGMTAAEIDAVLATIGSDFNLVTLANLQSAIDDLASKTGLTSFVSSL